jgi:hypothetical protein
VKLRQRSIAGWIGSDRDEIAATVLGSFEVT